MDKNNINNPTQHSEIKPRVAKISDTTKTENKNISGQKTSDSKEDNLFAAVYLNEKKNLSSTDHTVVAEKTEIVTVKPEITEEKESKKTVNNKIDNNKKSDLIFVILTVLTVLIFIASCVYLIFGLIKNNKSNENDADTEIKTSATISSPFNYEHIYSDTYPEGIQEKYKMLYDQNQSIAGWIRVPNTSIDMPIYQAKNNSYYVRTDNYDVYNRYGTAFLDMYSGKKMLTKNTVLHGHNFEDGLIFCELHNYTDIEFLKENPVIEYNTIYQDYKWKIIAVFYTNGDSTGDNDYLFYYIAASMGNNSFMEFYDEIQQRSLFHTGVDVQPTDKILTLSTCTRFFDKNNGVQANGRLAVIARLVRDSESEEIDTSLVKENDNVRYPQLYYDKVGKTNPYTNDTKWVARND